MNIKGIIISEKKLAKLSSVLPESLLRDEYEINGLSDTEISEKSGISSWEYIRPEIVSCFNYKIPKKYCQDNQQPSLEGNLLEGSTTGGSLSSDKEYGDNTRLDEVIYQGTPDTCDSQVMIQSDLIGNYER